MSDDLRLQLAQMPICFLYLLDTGSNKQPYCSCIVAEQNHVGQDYWSSFVGSCVPVLYEDEVSTEPCGARLLEQFSWQLCSSII